MAEAKLVRVAREIAEGHTRSISQRIADYDARHGLNDPTAWVRRAEDAGLKPGCGVAAMLDFLDT